MTLVNTNIDNVGKWKSELYKSTEMWQFMLETIFVIYYSKESRCTKTFVIRHNLSILFRIVYEL
jgi:hypothetical protein